VSCPTSNPTIPPGATEFYAEVLGLVPAMDLGWIVSFAAPGRPSAQISVMRADATAPVVPDASIDVDDVTRRTPPRGAWAARSFTR
jgi:hypothetical protein